MRRYKHPAPASKEFSTGLHKSLHSLTIVPKRTARTGHGRARLTRETPVVAVSLGLTVLWPAAYRTEADLVAGAARSRTGSRTPGSPLDS
jgi:hypothetical protein